MIRTPPFEVALTVAVVSPSEAVAEQAPEQTLATSSTSNAAEVAEPNDPPAPATSL